MASSVDRPTALAKQLEELSQLMSRFSKTIDDTVATATHEMNGLLSSIKQNIEETAVAVAHDVNEWEQMKTNLSKTRLQGRVTLDVGGREFTTTVETLIREKGTFFTALFSRQWELERDEKGRIFIDRNGDLFAELLDFMRNPDEFITPDERLHLRLRNEARFYKLNSFLALPTAGEKLERERESTIFVGDYLLTAEQKLKLNEFYGKREQIWELIYLASRDGFEAVTFHRLCDNRGPTLVIVRSTGGHLFGGYAAQSWRPENSYIAAPNSFLFVLTNASGSQPTKLDCVRNEQALHGGLQHGPVFGNGNDLYISDKSNMNTGSLCRITNTSSYANVLGLNQNTFTGATTFQTSEIEVFRPT